MKMGFICMRTKNHRVCYLLVEVNFSWCFKNVACSNLNMKKYLLEWWTILRLAVPRKHISVLEANQTVCLLANKVKWNKTIQKFVFDLTTNLAFVVHANIYIFYYTDDSLCEPFFLWVNFDERFFVFFLESAVYQINFNLSRNNQ